MVPRAGRTLKPGQAICNGRSARRKVSCQCRSAFVSVRNSGTPIAHRTERPNARARRLEERLLMASQWPNIHFTTLVDMPQQVSQSPVRDADFTSTWECCLCRGRKLEPPTIRRASRMNTLITTVQINRDKARESYRCDFAAYVRRKWTTFPLPAARPS